MLQIRPMQSDREYNVHSDGEYNMYDHDKLTDVKMIEQFKLDFEKQKKDMITNNNSLMSYEKYDKILNLLKDWDSYSWSDQKNISGNQAYRWQKRYVVCPTRSENQVSKFRGTGCIVSHAGCVFKDLLMLHHDQGQE